MIEDMSAAQELNLIKEVQLLREEVTASNISRQRLYLICTMIGLIGLVLWVTVALLLTSVSNGRDENRVNTQLSKEIIGQACFGFLDRTGRVSPLCQNSRFVNPDGTPKN